MPEIPRWMDDESFLRTARASWNPLTSTPLEEELLARLEQAMGELDELDAASAYLQQVEVHETSMEDAARMLAMLADKGINTPRDLETFLSTN